MVSPSPNTTDESPEKLVGELFDVIDGCRWNELGTVFGNECTYCRPGYEPLVGLPRVEHFYRRERIIASGRHQVDHVVSDTDTVACWGRFVGTSRTGQPLSEEFADVYRVREGKIVFRKTFFFRAAI
ncbi:nuclear transport factor 2 family protein [Streptomyces sp. NPDC047315]|uniref:nuclear transport factor 2 family protein n=1 Tax=Streptomyces sp. NPDC047315 TaxID=3155142 RepID=UPI0033CEFA79